MQLTREHWIEAARSALSEKGVAGVRIEALARQLNVSKGSFYWHFKNRQALLDALLQAWVDATDYIIERGMHFDNAAEQLRHIFSSIEASGGLSGEDMVQAWAKQDTNVARIVQQVEAKRLDYLQDIFIRAAFNPEEARRRAKMSYLAFLGYAFKNENNTSIALDLQRLGQDIETIFLGAS